MVQTAMCAVGAFLVGGEFRRRLTFTTLVVNVKDPLVVRPEPKSMCEAVPICGWLLAASGQVAQLVEQ